MSVITVCSSNDMKTTTVLITILAFVFAPGCKDKNTVPSVVGTWISQSSSGNELGQDFFYQDGTVRWSDDKPGVWSQEGFTINAKSSNGSNYVFRLSPEGDRMQGTWSDPYGNSGVATLIRKRAR
jgi:hypothetical protein